MSLSVDIGELRKQWMSLYLKLMRIKSTNESASVFINKYQELFAEMNEEIMKFLDMLEL